MIPEIEQMVDDFERGRLTRRQLVARLTTAAAAMAGAPLVGGAASGAEPARTFQATGVDHLALRVTDVARSRRFYERHLGLEVTQDCGVQSCFLRCGRDFLALFRGGTPGLDHFAFAIESYAAGDAVARLEAAGLRAKRRENRVYFDDPDGIEVQVTAGG